MFLTNKKYIFYLGKIFYFGRPFSDTEGDLGPEGERGESVGSYGLCSQDALFDGGSVVS